MSVVVKGAAAQELLRAVSKLLDAERGQNPDGMDDKAVADRVLELWNNRRTSDNWSAQDQWELTCEIEKLGFLDWPYGRQCAVIHFEDFEQQTDFAYFKSEMKSSTSVGTQNSEQNVTIVVVNACTNCGGECAG